MTGKNDTSTGASLPILYMVEVDVKKEDMEYFERWFAGRHAPDLYDAGFLRCTSYNTLDGSFSVLDLYELPDWEVLSSPGYQRVGKNDPYRDNVLKRMGSHGASLYDQIHISPSPEGSGATLDGPRISVIWFDARDADEAAIARAFDTCSQALKAQGALRVRMGKRTRDHPLVKSHRPLYVLVAEWPEDSSLPDMRALVEQTAVGALANSETYTAERAYPWRNTGFAR